MQPATVSLNMARISVCLSLKAIVFDVEEGACVIIESFIDERHVKCFVRYE